MSLLHEAIVAEKYGLRLTIDQLGKALCLAPQTIHNRIAKGEFKVPTYVDGEKPMRVKKPRNVAINRP